jgi:hypothetical protein
MWIRTQSNKLFNLDRVLFIDTMKNNIFANWDNADGYLPLATYATEQRALEVLDEIQEHIETRVVADDMMLKLLNTSNLSDDDLKTKMRKLSCVYIMPKE